MRSLAGDGLDVRSSGLGTGGLLFCLQAALYSGVTSFCFFVAMMRVMAATRRSAMAVGKRVLGEARGRLILGHV